MAQCSKKVGYPVWELMLPETISNQLEIHVTLLCLLVIIELVILNYGVLFPKWAL